MQNAYPHRQDQAAPGRAIALTHWRLAAADAAPSMALAPLDLPGMVDITAPGDIYLALHAAGRIPHPMDDRAEAQCAWVADQPWWYRADVEMPPLAAGQRLVLDFEGLDTYAAVWLNGEAVGVTDNMFRRWRFDVTARMRPGLNRLALCFTPPDMAITTVDLPTWAMVSSPSAENKRNFMRKAQFGWGWDFAPRLVTAGIWQAATLRVETRAVLRDVNFSTQSLAPDHGAAQVLVEAEAELFACDPARAHLTVTLRAPDGAVVAAAAPALKDGRASLPLTLAQPALWWTPELGAAHLYQLCVTLSVDGVIVDRRDLRVGVRSIALDTSADPDEPGASFFRFILNGVPIFARGVNWVPASSLVAAIEPAHYRHLLHLAAGAHMNMVRVWGGGIYERTAFYQLCDELGLLVWQDFMFACAPYPEHDAAFVDNVRAEVSEQIRRLRHHACLALWCGNNENQAIHGFFNSRSGRDDALQGLLYYDRLIPGLLAQLDPGTPYRASSPLGGPKNDHNNMLEGDIHDWTVWHGLPKMDGDAPLPDYDRSPAGVAYTRYAEDVGRFISEYGIQSSPAMATWRRALPREQRLLGSPGFLHRIKDRPQDKVNAMLVSVTGLPQTLEQYVDYTQLTQAEGLQFGIEHFRRRRPHCSGSLIWQFNDCWPGVSWSIVDYYGFAKAGYHYVRRAYAPVAASFTAGADGVELWLVNDTPETAAGQLRLTLDAFAGGTLWTRTVDYLVAPHASRRLWRGDDGDDGDGAAGRVLSVRCGAGRVPANRHFFAPLKDLVRPAPRPPQVTMNPVDGRTLCVTLVGVDYLYFVHLLGDDASLSFSDNYIDLRAGETRVITVSHPAHAVDAAGLAVRWR
ncbi:glycoside hydrolase family 2 sugar binding protein [Janthinobacterium sp. HH01]|uniref:beta-mannosidase n=1 Tax=Janthinobacterium sp. HH01 TaxID=1198452 RepID=UPI0002AEB8C2|nr:sugar-binding domain-containing protein [Janthinobacterium sp. HH01]ELX09252.1 glycoside hydrolase family 2 sugar binding protein [Janthinobacterium sp. HH01]